MAQDRLISVPVSSHSLCTALAHSCAVSKSQPILKRNFIAVSFDRLPGIVLLMVLFVASASLAVSGYNRGLAGDMNRARMTALALVLAAVMTTTTDFDRSLSGFVRLSQQPLADVLRDMDAVLGRDSGVPAQD